MKKRIFSGSINGKNYEDRTQFIRDLNAASELTSVSYNEQEVNVDDETPNTECKCKNCQKEIDVTDLTDAQKEKVKAIDNMFKDIFGVGMTDVFGGFLKAVQADKLLKPVENKQTNTDETENDDIHFMSQDELINKYVFPETSYKFDGSARDEYELDKFDKHLNDLTEDFCEEEWDENVDDEYVKDTFTNEIDKLTKQIESIEKKTRTIDEKLSDLENIIEIKKRHGFDYVKEDELYEEYTKQFDILCNYESYKRLLVEYYKELLKYIA